MHTPPDWLQGLFAVLPTPMVSGGGLDLDGLDRVVEHYLDGGAAGLVPASIAGEGDLLDDAERRAVIQRVVRRAAGRAPVAVGVLDERTDRALAQARVAAGCGAGALLVKPPRGDAQQILAHVGAIALAMRMPIVLLDHPKFGGLLPPSLLQVLVDGVPEIVGIKVEDEPTADKMARLRTLLGPRLRLFGGLGGVHCLHELEHGADGFFTGYPHPRALVDVMDCWRRGERAAAAAANARMLPVALREQADPDTMILQRKTLLRDAGVLREAVVRPRPPARWPA